MNVAAFDEFQNKLVMSIPNSNKAEYVLAACTIDDDNPSRLITSSNVMHPWAHPALSTHAEIWSTVQLGNKISGFDLPYESVYAMTSCGHRLYIQEEEQISCFDVRLGVPDFTIETNLSEDGVDFQSLTVFDSMVYHGSPGRVAVYQAQNGDPLFSFNLKDYVPCSLGLVVRDDNHNQIYIAHCETGEVAEYTLDGVYIKRIFKKTYGRAAGYKWWLCSVGDQLLVRNATDTEFRRFNAEGQELPGWSDDPSSHFYSEAHPSMVYQHPHLYLRDLNNNCFRIFQ